MLCKLQKLDLKLCSKKDYKINILCQIVTPQLSSAWQH